MSEYSIYPKQFRNIRMPVRKNTCFFLMPFHSDFDFIYGMIKKELNDFGLICSRVDEIRGSTPIINKIITNIIQSQYIIADLSRYNPNVFYELGVAHTFKDARNILLIKQKEDKVPFDITHLTYIEYDPENIRLLTSTIRKFIADNKHASDFYDALNLCGIINIIDENSNYYIEYLQGQLGSCIAFAIDLLNGRQTEVSENDVEELLNSFHLIILDILRNREVSILQNVMKVYFEVLSASSNYPIAERFIQSFLEADYEPYGLTASELLALKTDFVVLMASQNKKLHLTLSWIINYFTRSKSATIDLNRHKLEGFLLTSPHDNVNQAIVTALHNENCYIREHMADIIGEKRLKMALPSLYAQLKNEDNFYTASSIISAIGKLGEINGITSINEWLEENNNEIYTTKQFFVLRRALMAITALDDTPEEIHINIFNSKHGITLKEYFII